MKLQVRSLGIVLILAVVLGACESATAIPAGAHQVHVDATGAVVRLDPPTVRAGDVYLVVDLPAEGASLSMIQGAPGVGQRRSLTDADIARIQGGDMQDTEMDGFDNSCCGKVHKVTLQPGKYAFVLDSPELRPGVPSPALTILDVTP